MASSLYITVQAYYGACIFLIVLSGIVVVARLLGGHMKSRRFYVSDYLSVLAVIFVAATFAIFDALTKEINKPYPPGPDPYLLLQIGTASTIIAGAATWLAKAPILFLYIQLFGIKPWIRNISRVVLVITALTAIGLNSWVAATCNPTGKDSAELMQTLIYGTQVTSTSGVATGAIGVITDIIIFVLPIHVVLKLNLPLAKRISVMAVFLTGIIAVAASATSLYFRAASYHGELVDTKAAQVWTIIELTIAIMVGCAPAAYALWVSYAMESALLSRLTALVSLISLPRSFRSTRSKRSRKSSNSSTNRAHEQSEDIHGINLSHPYGVLGNASGKDGGRSNTEVVDYDRISIHK